MSDSNLINKAKILVVDDEEDLLDLIKMILKGSLYEVHTTSSGRIALEKLQEENYAVFILDIIMPEISGHELALKIKQIPKYKDTPIVFITGYMDEVEDIFEKYDTYGPVDYMMKPLDYHMLQSKINFLSQLFYQKLALENINKKRLQEIEQRKQIEQQLEERIKELEKELNDRIQAEKSLENQE